jgi:hypothetical protein
MMKNIWQKIQTVVAIACIGIYICSALYVGIRIYGESQWQNKLAEREFADLKDFASSAGVLGFSSAAFKRDIEDAIALSRTLQAVIIIGPRNAALVAEKTPDLVRWDGYYPRFNGGFNMLKRLQPAPLSIKGNNVTISVLASTLDFDVLLSILRPAFAGVLVALIVSFFMLIAEVYFQKSAVETFQIPASKAPAKPQEEIIDEIDDGGTRQNYSTDKPPAEQEKFPVAAAPEPYEDDNFGDFDDEPTFADDLTPELEEAEENSEDLCLLSASWTSGDAPLNILAGTAVIYFKSGTRVFERATSGIYAIIPDENIDNGLNAAKEFYREAMAKLPKGIDTRLVVGLSSRAKRKVDAERLIHEADSALFKAREDEQQPIVAFKADPQKYKAFIAKQV